MILAVDALKGLDDLVLKGSSMMSAGQLKCGFPAVDDEPGVISVSVPKAAKMLGLSKSTLWPLITSGQVPSILIGKRRLVLVDDIKAFLLSRKA